MHANSCALFRKHVLPLFLPGISVLEVGPHYENRPSENWWCPFDLLKDSGAIYHHAALENFERDGSQRVVMLYEYTLKCQSNLFDVVFTTNVIEHVRRIWTWTRELSRVIRSGGLLVHVNPVSWPFHESPVDCWRIYPDGHRALFEDSGLEKVFTWHGCLTGDGVIDCVAVGRKRE